MKPQKRHIEIEIDKLTNSIENRVSGEVFDTDIVRVEFSDLKLLKESEWLFDWKKEAMDTTKGVYRLVITAQPSIIQGLISIEDMGYHIFAHLIENARHNKGVGRQYIGGAGNMVAFACKKSFESGYYGYISFIAKTALKNHYMETLGAQVLFKDKMVIEPPAAFKLIERYYKNK